METRLKPDAAVDEGSGTDVGVNVEVAAIRGMKVMVGAGDNIVVAVGKTGVRTGAHPLNITVKRIILSTDVNLFNTLPPFDST
jgi:hypothetical protein